MPFLILSLPFFFLAIIIILTVLSQYGVFNHEMLKLSRVGLKVEPTAIHRPIYFTEKAKGRERLPYVGGLELLEEMQVINIIVIIAIETSIG